MANWSLGNGSTKRQGPRKAFESSKGYYSKKLDFGQSSIPEGQVYRRRWVEKKSWFWTIVKLVVLGFILLAMIEALMQKF